MNPAQVTIRRDADNDVRQRQVLVSIDDGPRATLMFGDAVTLEVAPGAHTLKTYNTLVKKNVDFTAAAGEQIAFQVSNHAGRLTLGFLSLVGVAPLFLTITRKTHVGHE